MDIEILSMQRVPNFGSVLQAYSLRKIINNFPNVNCSFIDIESREEDKKLLDNTKDYSVENGKKSLIKKIDKYTINRYLHYKEYKKQIEILKYFQHTVLNLDNHPINHYDVCVIGSDEVFNCLQPSEWGYSSQLFGNVKNASKVITYAASCGSTNISDLPKSVFESIKNASSNLNSISVRDSNTYEFISHFTDKNIEINLDPVLIGNFDSEIDLANKTDYSNYCIIYSYYNRIHNIEEIRSIKDFCRKKGLRLVSVFAPQYWINDYKILDPFELLSFFRNASFVITDTFHGSIFAAKYAKRFGILVRNSNSNKLNDLINRIGIENHRIDDILDLDKVYQIIDNKDDIRKLEKAQIQKTINYLERSIFD